MVIKCMEEAKVSDAKTFKAILMDTSSLYPQENCLRKCLYAKMGLINDDGEIEVKFDELEQFVQYKIIF